MTKIIFIWLMLTGQVKHQQTINNIKQYELHYDHGKIVDFATKHEIHEYIKTGKFKYIDNI